MLFIGRKIGMTRVSADGRLVPVSAVRVAPMDILRTKTAERDGYAAVVVGSEPLKKKSKTKTHARVAEFRVEDASDFADKKTLSLADFADAKMVKVVGTSRGHGFTGVIKRHNFSRGPETHGSHHHRQPGSASGVRSGGGRTPKGKRYPGQHGNTRVTVSRVPVVSVDAENGVVVLKGPIPGSPKGFVSLSPLAA